MIWCNPGVAAAGTWNVKVTVPSDPAVAVPRSIGSLCSWKSIDVLGVHPDPVSVTDWPTDAVALPWGTSDVEEVELDVDPPPPGVLDDGVLDAGVLDDGVLELGVLDGGVLEAGVLDGGVLEAGVLDGGVLEAGVLDGGVLELGLSVAHEMSTKVWGWVKSL